MNTAYHDYLTDALSHYMCNEDDDQAIHRFLDWLKDYQPDRESMAEPDIYTYGDAQGQYAPTYIDRDSITAYGADPDKLSAALKSDIPGILTAWVYEIAYIAEQADCVERAFDNMLDNGHVSRDDIEVSRRTQRTSDAEPGKTTEPA